ncbi:MAG: MBL fold metallo-hydrolase [Chloroflexi bacterium]|nr:MBL fold metallo-hydrolase [Chloroflexota bacterium]
MQKVSPNVYAETGFRGSNCGFVVTKEGVVMVDTPMTPTDAVKWREEIAKYGHVRYLINTEPHADHHTGNHFFGGTVIAHEGTRPAILASSVDQFRERFKTSPENLSLLEGFRFRAPDITFSKSLTFYLGDHTFHLIHMPGHTPYQLAVHIPEERVCFTSDNIFCKVQAWLREAVLDEWQESLKQLQQLDVDVLVPGHGIICDRGYVPEMSAFIQAWVDTVKAAIARGMSLEEAQEKVSLLDRYPMEAGTEAMAQQVQWMNVTRLYEVLKSKKP